LQKVPPGTPSKTFKKYLLFKGFGSPEPFCKRVLAAGGRTPLNKNLPLLFPQQNLPDSLSHRGDFYDTVNTFPNDTHRARPFDRWL